MPMYVGSFAFFKRHYVMLMHNNMVQPYLNYIHIYTIAFVYYSVLLEFRIISYILVLALCDKACNCRVSYIYLF